MPAVLRRQGLDRDAARRAQGVRPGADPVPDHARRHRASTSRRSSPTATAGSSSSGCSSSSRPCPDAIERGLVHEEPNGSRNRIQTPVLLEAAESEQVRRPVRRRAGATRRRPAPRSACSRSATSSASGTPRTSGRRSGTCTTAASTRARASASSRCRTGPSSTSGPTSQTEDIEIPALYLAEEREVVERDGMLYAVNEFTPLRDGETAQRAWCAATARSATRTSPRPSSRTPTRVERSSSRDRGGPDHRARRDPRRRQGQRDLMEDRKRKATSDAGATIAPRFATAGSVDDGKCTLIGRLLFDSKSLFSDQLAAVERVSPDRGHDYTDLALLTDGLRAEREQGITIDVAYRYFATPRRKFIIADTPGHIQYTRNMVTGASTADVALLLLDARKGITEQSRRHAFLATLLGVPHLVVCVNKMDLVDWSEDVFEDPRRVRRVRHAPPRPRPVVHPGLRAPRRQRRRPRPKNMPWYDGLPLLPPPRAAARGVATATSSTCASRSSTSIRPQSHTGHRLPRLRGHGRVGRAQAGRPVLVAAERASSRRSRRSRRPTARSTRRSRRWP